MTAQAGLGATLWVWWCGLPVSQKSSPSRGGALLHQWLQAKAAFRLVESGVEQIQLLGGSTNIQAEIKFTKE